MLWLFGMYAGVLGAILYFNYLNSGNSMKSREFDKLVREQERQMDKYHSFMKLANDADDLKEYEVGDAWENKAKAALEEAERINRILLDL